jgi:hypothetical protein
MLQLARGQDHVEGTPAPLCAIGGIGSAGGSPAGTYRHSNTGASQQLNDDLTGLRIQIAVSQFVNVFNPRVGPSTHGGDERER